ncbi:MAG: hypothetical protein HKN93_06200, partial [Acidimicrobiia bacterium]|nr:hypothetical protein [Acidimicrobiia bacterium]
MTRPQIDRPPARSPVAVLALLLFALSLGSCTGGDSHERHIGVDVPGPGPVDSDPSPIDKAQALYSLSTEMADQGFVVTTGTGLGLIRLDPPGGVYAPGTVVTVAATPSILSTFDGWRGDLSGSANPTTIVMDGDKQIAAAFSRPPIAEDKVTLDYLIDGPGGGSITLD